MQDLQFEIAKYDPPVVIATDLTERFGDMFAQMEKWEEKASTLVVTDVTQTGLMYEARQARLAVKNIRVDVEKTRKAMKEDSLRTSQAIDGVARVIREKLEEIEKHLEAQENYAANIEAARVEALRVERYNLILSYLVPEILPTPYPMWGEMHEDDFQATLAAAKEKARQIEAERVARIEKERAEKEELERLRIENDRQARELAEANKARLEAEERERLRLYEIDKQKLAAEALRRSEENDRLEQERAAQQAPDREKLRAYGAALLQVQCAPIQEKEMRGVLQDVKILLAKIDKFIEDKTA